MTRAPVLLLVAAAACYAPHPQAGASCVDSPCPSGLECAPATRTCEVPGSGGGDGRDAATEPPADASACFGTGLVRLCLDAAPSQPVTFGDATLDTDTSPACVGYDGTGLCVVAGTDVAITGTLRATGSRPLVVVAARSITVLGGLDVASRRIGASMSLGAGAAGPGTLCVTGGTPAQEGGGPGGSFGGRGGDGGLGGGNASAAAAPAVTGVTSLRGGCGGRAGQGTSPGAAGAGGGAVYLIARTGIAVAGSINASGAGGGGAVLEGGGGGAGSGGMIGLDAPLVGVAGVVFANGGGGGEGGGMATGNSGANPVSPIAAALGGSGGAPNGGDGGNGSAGASKVGARGSNNTATAGGGGGGGGAGVILVVPGPPTGIGAVSPPPS